MDSFLFMRTSSTHQMMSTFKFLQIKAAIRERQLYISARNQWVQECIRRTTGVHTFGTIGGPSPMEESCQLLRIGCLVTKNLGSSLRKRAQSRNNQSTHCATTQQK